MRRAWKDRLCRNVDEISKELKQRYKTETGFNADDDPKEFLDWIGLKATFTAILRVKWPLK